MTNCQVCFKHKAKISCDGGCGAPMCSSCYDSTTSCTYCRHGEYIPINTRCQVCFNRDAKKSCDAGCGLLLCLQCYNQESCYCYKK